MAMAAMVADQDVARPHVQGREEVEGPMPDIVVGATGNRPGAQGQKRLRTLQRLELSLGIEREDQGVGRGMQVEPHDIQHLLGQPGVATELERLGLVRLEVEGPPDAVDGHVAHADLPRQAPGAPMRGVLRRAQGGRDDLLDLHGRIPTRTPSPGPFLQPGQSGGGKARPPGPDGMEVQMPPLGNGSVGVARGGLQDNARALGHTLGRGPAPDPPLQDRTLRVGQLQGHRHA